MELNVDIVHDIAAAFVYGPIEEIMVCEGGHINDSFIVVPHDDEQPALLLQRINGHVFQNPRAVVDNASQLLPHLANCYRNCARQALELIPRRNCEPCAIAPNGDIWRALVYIPNARSLQAPQNLEQVRAATRAFVEFHQHLRGFQRELQETIPDFHNTPMRLAQLNEAVAQDSCDRVAECRAEIEFVRRHESICSVIFDALASGRIPTRLCHNDAKVNNLLYHQDRDEVLAVIDLDTVMPGTPLYDVGDLIRSCCCRLPENATDLSQVVFDMEACMIIEEEFCGQSLTDEESSMIRIAGRLITLETGIRFLTDHLNGDQYFRVAREGENLDRARRQFALVEAMPA